MKKYVLYLLLFVIIADNAHIGQLAKLPALYRHFTEHKSSMPGLSLGGFLSMHYWGQDLNDNDDEKDMQLPFKKLDHHVHPFVFLPTEKIFPSRQAFYWHQQRNYPAEQRDDYRNPALEALFRPPQA